MQIPFGTVTAAKVHVLGAAAAWDYFLVSELEDAAEVAVEDGGTATVTGTVVAWGAELAVELAVVADAE
jgi:hypothetical protein